MTTVNTIASGGQGVAVPSGFIGYQVRAFTSSASAVSLTTSTWVDVVAGGITLGVGTWDINAIAGASQLTAVTGTRVIVGIGTVAGNSGTGINQGDNRIELPIVPTSVSDVLLSIPQYRVSVTSGTQTFYLKVFAIFSAGTMGGYGRISAVLVA